MNRKFRRMVSKFGVFRSVVDYSTPNMDYRQIEKTADAGSHQARASLSRLARLFKAVKKRADRMK